MKRWVLWFLIAWGLLGPLVALIIVLADFDYRISELEDKVLSLQAQVSILQEFLR